MGVWELDVFVSPEFAQVLLSLLIGFAVAGLIASAYQLATHQPLSFKLLQNGVATATFAALAMLVFAAPFIIMRNTVRGRLIEARRFEFAMLATILAGIWSLMSGTVVMLALRAVGIPA